MMQQLGTSVVPSASARPVLLPLVDLCSSCRAPSGSAAGFLPGTAQLGRLALPLPPEISPGLPSTRMSGQAEAAAAVIAIARRLAGRVAHLSRTHEQALQMAADVSAFATALVPILDHPIPTPVNSAVAALAAAVSALASPAMMQAALAALGTCSPDALHPMHHYSQAMSAASLGLDLLTELLTGTHVHSLSDSDMLRMLSTAVVATKATPQLLDACVSLGLGSSNPQLIKSAAHSLLHGALRLMSNALTLLVFGWLPERVQQAVQATFFRPDLLLHWLRSTVAALQAVGCDNRDKQYLWHGLVDLLSSPQLGVQPLLLQDEPPQLALVRLLAAEALAWPSQPPQSASELDAALLPEQAAVAQLLAADALHRGFQQFAAEQQAGSLGVQLAGYFAALPLDASPLSPAAARSLAQLLLWCGEVAGRVLLQHWAAPITAAAEQQQAAEEGPPEEFQVHIPSNDPAVPSQIITLTTGRPAPPPPNLQIPAGQLQMVAAAALQCNRLLAQLAAAASGSGSGNASSSSGGGSSAGTSSHIQSSLGQLCLELSAAGALRRCLSMFNQCSYTAMNMLQQGVLSSPNQLARACTIAEALLRLQPALAALPADVPFNVPAHAVAKDDAGARLVPVWPLQQASQASQHAVAALGTACTPAKRCCSGTEPAAAAAREQPSSQNTEAVAWYTFHLANSALKWLWLSSESSEVLLAAEERKAAPLPALAGKTYLLAVQLALDAQHSLRMQLSEEQPIHATASRRLDCLVLGFLDALPNLSHLLFQEQQQQKQQNLLAATLSAIADVPQSHVWLAGEARGSVNECIASLKRQSMLDEVQRGESADSMLSLLNKVEAAVRAAASSLGGSVAQADLELRTTLALGQRRCASLRCTNMAGASEAELPTRRCGGCGAVRYCSEACSRAHWRAHRVVCRRLQAQRAAAG